MALIPVSVLLGLVVAVAIGVGLARRSPPSRETAVVSARSHTVRAAVAAILLGAMAAVSVGTAGFMNGSPGGLGVTALLIPITFGVVHTLVLAIGELTWPRPQGEVRRARLVHRGLLDAVPPRLARVAAISAAFAVVTLAGGALLADADGRSFTYGSDATAGIATAGPFPGLFYGLPAAIGLGLLAVVAGGTLMIVANRPAVATADDGIETALRQASAHRVVRVAVGVPLFVAGGLLVTGGRSLHSVASSGLAPGLLDATGVACALVGGAAMLAGVAVACLRAPGVPADAPAVAAG